MITDLTHRCLLSRRTYRDNEDPRHVRLRTQAQCCGQAADDKPCTLTKQPMGAVVKAAPRRKVTS